MTHQSNFISVHSKNLDFTHIMSLGIKFRIMSCAFYCFWKISIMKLGLHDMSIVSKSVSTWVIFHMAGIGLCNINILYVYLLKNWI